MGAEVAAKGGTPGDAMAALLAAFPDCAADLNQILAMLDDGRFVDVKALPDARMKSLLQSLFNSLGLNQTPYLSLFYLPLNAPRTLSALSPVPNYNEQSLPAHREDDSHDTSRTAVADPSGATPPENSPPVIGPQGRPPLGEAGGAPLKAEGGGEDSAAHEVGGSADPIVAPAPRKRPIGPAMPSAEVLAAAARMTGVGARLDSEDEDELLVGPMPSAAAPENATQTERYEEVARVLEAVLEGKNAYVVLGVAPGATAAESKKRYRRASLLVHPDKCTHGKAQEAFAALNKAHLELEDPNKRAAVDRKIEDEKEREAYEEELKERRVAAEWRKIRGEALAGDEEILSGPAVPLERDVWMTELPPERTAARNVTQSTTFSRTEKRARGDTTMWTDTPAIKLQRAQQGYIQASAHAHAIEAGSVSGDATGGQSAETIALVQEYNEKRRGKTLMEQHQEKLLKEMKEKKKKSKKAAAAGGPQEINYRPWDRDRDMAIGPKGSAGMMNVGTQSQHLASRFVSTQRK